MDYIDYGREQELSGRIFAIIILTLCSLAYVKVVSITERPKAIVLNFQE
jgi:hypothetical protein